jgi:D-sedoheptulose 7-phosphate isomerase
VNKLQKMTEEAVRQVRDGMRLGDYLEKEAGTMAAIAEMIAEAFRNGKKVLVFGNGGSAADAQHIAAELAGRMYLDRDSLPAIALTTNSSSVTAIANDYGYETIFAHQLRGLGGKGDVAFGLGAGGNSPNVVLAMEEAKRRGMITVGFTGKKGGKVKDMCDYVMHVPAEDTARIQEAQMMAGHIICALVESSLFGDGNTSLVKK